MYNGNARGAATGTALGGPENAAPARARAASVVRPSEEAPGTAALGVAVARAVAAASLFVTVYVVALCSSCLRLAPRSTRRPRSSMRHRSWTALTEEACSMERWMESVPSSP